MSKPDWLELKVTLERHLSVAADQELFDEEVIVRICEVYSNAKVAATEQAFVDFQRLLSSLELSLRDREHLAATLDLLDRLNPR